MRAITWGGTVTVVYLIGRMVSALAGQTTLADIAVQFLMAGNLREFASYGIAGGGIVYGLRERRLRKSVIRHLSKRKVTLERHLDPNRSSSQLTETGETKTGGPMTVAEGIASILQWSINLGLACILICWCRRRYRVDALRDLLFVSRDELFDLALDGPLDFSDDAYVLLRQTINDLLRFSHKINLLRVLLVYHLCRGPAFDERREAHRREWENALLALPNEDARNRIGTIHEALLLEVVKHTTLGWILWACVIAMKRFSPTPIKHTDQLMRKGSLVEIEARQAGEAGGGSGLVPATG